MPPAKRELLPGTLDMLILRTLTVQSMHGYGIAQHIQRLSLEKLRIEEGSLYPALQRMLRRGWLRAEWRPSENNRRARYYELTREGRRQLEEQTAEWRRSSGAVERVLQFALQGG
jgi:PadR family transcriptional regulator, regulatory protein PadR